MKYLGWLVGVIVTLVIGVYVLAFTSVGNSIVAPIVESKINEQANLSAKLNKFSLSMSEIDVVLALSESNTISVKGNYSLFSKSFDLAYVVMLDKLESLQELAKAPIRGAFFTQGTLQGDMALVTIKGNSNVASSDTKYDVILTNFEPTKVIASIKQAKVEELLYIAGQPNFASASLDVNANLTSLKPENLAGDVDIKLDNGNINTKIMNKNYGVNIPKTLFSSKTTMKLKGQDIDYNTWFKSNLANIGSSGNIVPKTLAMDLVYALDVKELAVLKPLTNANIRGALNLKGTLKGDKKNLVATAKSNLASSNTNIKATLKDFTPMSADVNIKDLKLQELLYMVHQPIYTNGLFSVDAKITDARAGKLKGIVNSNINKGDLNSKLLTKMNKFKSAMPKTTYTLATTSQLNNNLVDTKVDFDSTLANLDVKQARFNLNDSSIKSDYVAYIPNLDKLFFATQRHLKGDIKVNGDLSKAKDLDFNAFSKVAGGEVVANLHNDDFTAKVKSVQTMDVLKMLIYPQIFKSSLEGDLKYNIAKNRGKFEGFLVDGKFAKNQMLTLLKQFGKTDLYKQKFKGSVNADINAEKIRASLDLKSNTSAITTKDTKLNSKTKIVNSVVTVVANRHPVTVKIKGNVNSPKVSVDTKKLIESKTGEAIEKGAKKLFDKLF